jgi:hypothetical protein
MAAKQTYPGRKFLLVALAGLLLALNDSLNLGIDRETIWQIVVLIGGFVGLEGAADIVSRFRAPK